VFRSLGGSVTRIRLPLNSPGQAPIVDNMKRFAPLLLGLVMAGVPALRAQDAASDERYNKLSGQIEDLRSSQDALNRKLESIAKEIETLRGQMEKQPSANFASDEDLKRLAETVKEIDRKRLDDYEKIRTELKGLGKTITASNASVHKSPPSAVEDPGSKPKVATPDKGFEYEVKKDDTLRLIVKAYRESNVKITMDQVLKANPGLKPEKLRVGQKIFIPAPQS
jgi:LysM repeat protein/outer membrane murein-binding lipoprotein Lpp